MAKQADNTQIKEITAQIEKGIQELFESEKYRQYLNTMSRFHSYSFRNTMLIHLQRPDATMVAGYNHWEKSFGRHVKKGEKGIKIFAPAPYMKKIQTEKIDPDTHLPMIDADGKPVTEEKSVKMPRFKVVSVFDVKQTFGKPIPQLASQLTGNVENYDIFMEALRRSSPLPINIVPLDDTDGYCYPDHIDIREGMSEIQTVCAAIHEMGHGKLHRMESTLEPMDDASASKDRLTKEVEAESISYVVCQYFGIETGENSFGYIAEWSSGKELKELKASLETINQTASELIGSINKHYLEICQEKGIDLTHEPTLPQESSPEIPTKKEIAALARDIDQLFLDYYTFSHLQEYPNRKTARKHLREELADPSASAFLSELQNIAGDVDSDSAPKAAELVERLTDYLNRMFPNWKEPPNPPLQSEPLKIDYAPPVTEGLFLLDDNLYVHINLESSGNWDVSAYDKETFALMGCCILPDKPNMSMVEVMGTSFKNLGKSYEHISVVSMKDRPAIYEKTQESKDVNNLRRFLNVFPSQEMPKEQETSTSDLPIQGDSDTVDIPAVPILPVSPYYDNTVPDPLVSQDFMRDYGYKDMEIIDEAERAEIAPSAFALSQDHIDDILRLGFKSISSRMEAVSLFQKQLPIMDIAHRLPELYQEYSGFILNGQDVSVWFDDQCIHIAQGQTAKFVSAPKILPWQTAAERIGTLMEEGRFATNTEVAEAPSYMLRKLAQKLHLIRDDMRASTKEAGYLSTIVGEYTGGYTDSMESTMKSLSDPVSRETIVQEYKTFLAAYQADRQIMRWHRHDFDGTLRLLEELSLPRREYAADFVVMPEAGRFITDDEIDDALVSYAPFVNGKQRIYQFFQESHTAKERSDMLRSAYGIGGNGKIWTDGKGVRFKSHYAPELKLPWSKVVRRIDDLIQNDRYLTSEEQKDLQEQQTQPQQADPTDPGEDIWQYNSIKEKNPNKLVLFQTGDSFEIYGDDGQEAAKKLGLTMGERKLPNGMTIDMAAIPANTLEQSIETLRRDYGIIIAAYQEGQTERQLYPMKKLEPQPEIPEPKREITQEDIDEVLTTWQDWMPPKQEVIAYMKEHGRERATAVWLAQVYGFSDAKLPMQITVSGISEPVTLSWPKVQRRVNQLIQEDKFLTEQEKAQIAFSAPRPPRYDPKRFSVRELPDGNGDLAIWDATHRIFHHRDNTLIHFDNAVSANNYLAGLQKIAKDARNGTLEDSAFHVGASITYHINDTFRSQRNTEQKSDCVIDYISDDHVWYTIPDEPRQEPYSMRRGHFEACLEDGTFYLTDPYEKLLQNVQQEKAQISSTLPSEDSPGQFAFGGYHFVPIGNFKEGYDLEEVMRSQIRSDPELGISKYDWGTMEYSHAAFYRASGNSSADVFLCVENGRYYLPGENELFHYTGDFQEIKQEKTVPEQTSVPTIRELYDRYLPFVRESVEQDIAYRNACGHSGRENAVLACSAAIRRVVLEADDTQLLKLFVDMPDFRRRLQKDIIEQTYQPLHELLRPLSQDDIDNALRTWNGSMASKRAVVHYLKAHAQEEDAAEWLSREYYEDDNSGMISVRAGSPEGMVMPWPLALSRITQLIQNNDFYTAQERENGEDIDPVATRETEDALLEEAKKLISSFCLQEYTHDADYHDLSEIGIAFTTEEDSDLPIQVNVDLVNFRIDRCLHDVRLEPRQYSSLQDLIDNELIALDFNDLVYVSEEEVESYYRQKELPIPIAEYRRSNGRWVQGWEVPSIGAEYAGTSSEIYFADRTALYDAVKNFEQANHISNPVIDENGNYIDKEFLYAAYDEYVGMSHRAELEAYVPRFVNLAESEPVEPYLAQIYYAKQNGLDEDDIDYIIAEANASGQPYTVEKASAARLILEDRLDRWNPEINNEIQDGSFDLILEDDPNLPWANELHNSEHYEDDYGLLRNFYAIRWQYEYREIT